MSQSLSSSPSLVQGPWSRESWNKSWPSRVHMVQMVLMSGCRDMNFWKPWTYNFKTSLTFKCLIEHLLADFSYSRPLDTYLWKQMMKMNRNITYKWCNIDKKHLLFKKRKCHKFSWLFTASCCSPRRRSICACRIACKVPVSIGL